MIKYKDTEYKIKPYSIEAGMAYDDFIEPKRKAYLLKFTKDIDREHLQAHYDKINAQQEIVDSFEAELSEEDTARKAVQVAVLDKLKADLAADAYAQDIKNLLDELDRNALRQAVIDRKCAEPFFEAVLDGDLSKIEYKGIEYVVFAMEVMTGFFLELTATLKSKESSLITTQA